MPASIHESKFPPLLSFVYSLLLHLVPISLSMSKQMKQNLESNNETGTASQVHQYPTGVLEYSKASPLESLLQHVTLSTLTF
ncbi:hypothetical protein D5086_022835 [Populus alba]|uniref:Uncharacterized protein n=1 Tax=Populus alba TaxID=43335 RepID=A0ACC4B9N5_POPAL